MSAPTANTTPRPVGYWTVKGDITSEQAALIREQLPPDPYVGQIIVREGITLYWTPLAAAPLPAMDIPAMIPTTCHNHRLYNCWQCHPRIAIEAASAADRERAAAHPEKP